MEDGENWILMSPFETTYNFIELEILDSVVMLWLGGEGWMKKSEKNVLKSLIWEGEERGIWSKYLFFLV